ncbi:alpha-galactosidase [Roseiflexus sp.]
MTRVGSGDSSETWSIATDQVDLVVSLAHGRLTWTIGGATGGLDLSSATGTFLRVNGQTPVWTQIVNVAEHSADNGGRLLTLTLDTADGRMRLTRHFHLFADHPFVRTWATLENRSSAVLLIDQCDILTLAPHGEPPLYLFHVEQFSWNYRRDFFSQHEVWLRPGCAPHEIRMGSYPAHHWGPSSCAWFALRDGLPDWNEDPPKRGRGIVCGIEFNGKSRLRAWATTEQVSLVSQIDDLAHRLAPGAIFEIPAYFVGRFEGDWDEAGYVTQRFAGAHVHPPMPDDRYPWVQYNSWRYEQNINEEQQLAAIDRCAELGIELAVMDLGWARMIGDWRPDPVKFPRGLRPLVERAHAYGMRFGVHVALAQCNPDAPVAREHPDWLIHTGNDYYGAGPLCLGHEPCRAWLIEQLIRLIDEEGIDYIIQDGEDMVKRCERSDHTHAPGDSNYANSQYGLDIVIESLRRARPHLVLENCEDGGCMMTYKMARLYHTSITVDNTSSYATRQGVYGASYPFSPRYSVRYMQDDPSRYTLRSSIFGGPLILMQRVTEWNEAQMAETRQAIEQYKALRHLIRSAKIIHLKAPQHNIDGLGWGWDAIQAVAPDTSRSVIMVYRARGDLAERTFRPRGLLPEAHYAVRFVDSGRTLQCAGAELERDGITITLDEFDSEIVMLERVEG